MDNSKIKRIDSLGKSLGNGNKVILQTVVHEDSSVEYVVRVEIGFVLHSETECDDDYQQARVVFDSEVAGLEKAVAWASEKDCREIP